MINANNIPLSDEPIVLRFFEALDYLKRNKIVRGISVITNELDIDRRNLYKVRRDPVNRSIRLAWVARLVVKYNISPIWLLTGEGCIINDEA